MFFPAPPSHPSHNGSSASHFTISVQFVQTLRQVVTVQHSGKIKHQENVDSTLDQRRRRWPSGKSTFFRQRPLLYIT